jgi:hypothetical protein
MDRKQRRGNWRRRSEECRSRRARRSRSTWAADTQRCCGISGRDTSYWSREHGKERQEGEEERLSVRVTTCCHTEAENAITRLYPYRLLRFRKSIHDLTSLTPAHSLPTKPPQHPTTQPHPNHSKRQMRPLPPPFLQLRSPRIHTSRKRARDKQPPQHPPIPKMP